MNQKGGCSLGFAVLVIGGILISLLSTPGGWLLIAVVAVLIAMAVYLVKNNNKEKFLEGLRNQAEQLQLLISGNPENVSLAMSLGKGEKVLATLPNTLLTEYESTGSTYSGVNAGVSFPLVGDIRGNVGGQSGQLSKNPEQLMVVDVGTSIYTNQRIVFTGAKLVRDWNLDKVVSLEPGPNGFNVKIAVSNQSRTSGLQSPDIHLFGPGYLAAYTFNYYQNGAESAKKWAEDLIVDIRKTVDSATKPKTK